jgi:hypothetical protein
VAAVLYHEGKGDSQEGIGWSPTCYVTVNLFISN